MTIAPEGFAAALRLGPNPGSGRDLVVGDVHGHFATLRHALAELEVGRGDRLFSIGDLVDRGPHSCEALSWMAGGPPGPGDGPAVRFDLVVRGNHEQLMLDALASAPDYEPLWPTGRDLWYDNGGSWWRNPERRPKPPAEVWTAALGTLPFAARIETAHGPVGPVHACPVFPSWEELEEALGDEGFPGRHTRMRALWSRVWHRIRQPEIGERGCLHAGAVAGVRAVVTGHTPVKEPVWRANVLDIDTGIARKGLRRLTVARIDTEEIGTWTFDRVPEDRAWATAGMNARGWRSEEAGGGA